MSNPLPPRPGPRERLVIAPEDLTDPGPGTPVAPPPLSTRSADGLVGPAPPGRKQPNPQAGVPSGRPVLAPLGVAPPPRAGTGGGTGVLVRLGGNPVTTGVGGGVVGGLTGFVFAEILRNVWVHTGESAIGAHTYVAVWTGVFGAVLGAVLMAWDGISTGSAARMLVGAARGAAAGTAAGLIGGFLGNVIYNGLAEQISDIGSARLIARPTAWGIFGCLIGIGTGLPGGARKTVNGAVGGLLGGAAGGLVFQLLDNADTFSGDVALRLVGLTVTGLGVGLAIGVVETARKEAWITVGSGPMAGKQFILYNARTRVGSDHRCDVVLAKDRSVAPVHAVLERDPRGRVVARPEPGLALAVNGASCGEVQLRSGDHLTVGTSALVFTERAARGRP